MVLNLIEAAIKFADKLDHMIRATFGAYSSKEISSAESSGAEGDGQKEAKAPSRHKITPPPRALISHHIKHKRHPFWHLNECNDISEVHVRCEGQKPDDKSDLDFLMIKKGHVKNLIKMYDEISDLSSESSMKGPKNKYSLTEAPQQDPFPTTPHRDVELKPSVRKKKGLNKVVTKPPKVASVSSTVSHHSLECGEAESDQRITLFEEAETAYVADSNSCGENGDVTHDYGLQRRSGRRTLWSMFCIPWW